MPEAKQLARTLLCRHCGVEVDLAAVAHVVAEVRGDVLCVDVQASPNRPDDFDRFCDALAKVKGEALLILGVM